ncbi:SPOR domain-containing protein [bacterium]|nr:SPOR domain-containing protein [bacterium]
MAKPLNKPTATPPKRKRGPKAGTYWLVFVVCTLASFGGGFWITYRGTQVSIKEPAIGPSMQPLPVESADPSSMPGSAPTPLVTPAPVDPFATAPEATPAPLASVMPSGTVDTALPPTEPPAADPFAQATPAPRLDEGAKTFRVQVGNYDSRDSAQSMVDELSAAGITAKVVQDSNGQYHAQIGAYSKRDRALAVADEVNAKGYSVTIRQ